MRMKRTVAMLLSAMLTLSLCLTALPKTALAELVDPSCGIDADVYVQQSGGMFQYSQNHGGTWTDYSGTLRISGSSSVNNIVVDGAGTAANPVKIALDSLSITLGDGVAKNALELKNGACVELTLRGANTLKTADQYAAAVRVPTGCTLTIKGASSGDTLTAETTWYDASSSDGAYGACIGGNGENSNGERCGTVDVVSGTVNVQSAKRAVGACIGGGGGNRGGDGGTVFVRAAGTVHATGGESNNGACIGGGGAMLSTGGGSGGELDVFGTVTAVSSGSGAAIGGGASGGAGGTVTVRASGNLDASTKDGKSATGAAIGGGGSGGVGGTLTVYGTVTARSGSHNFGAAIGGGGNSTGAAGAGGGGLTIYSGTVTASAGSDGSGAAVGGGGTLSGTPGAGGPLTMYGGELCAKSDGDGAAFGGGHGYDANMMGASGTFTAAGGFDYEWTRTDGGSYTRGSATPFVGADNNTAGFVGIRPFTPTYDISLSPADKDFGARSVGYSALLRPGAQDVTVTNNGNSAVTLNAIVPSTGYDVTLPSTWSNTLAAGASQSFSVRPQSGLSAGTYNGAITVSTTKNTSAAFTPLFVVNGALNVTISGNTSIIAGQSTQLTANVTGGTGSYTYAWSGGGISDTTQAVTVSPATTTTYTVVVTDQGDTSKSAMAEVTVTAQSIAFYWTSDLTNFNPPTIDYGTLAEGYAQPGVRNVAVKNTGTANIWLENLAVDPSPTGKFSIDPSSNWSEVVSPNFSRFFTIQPEEGLGVGVYETTITIHTKDASGNPTPATLTLRIKLTVVSAAPAIDFASNTEFTDAAAKTIDFGTLTQGYAQPAEKNVVIQNTGNMRVKLVPPDFNPWAQARNYLVSHGYGWGNELPAGDAQYFLIQPNANLPAGNYDADITIGCTDVNGNPLSASCTLHVKFTIQSSDRPPIAITPSATFPQGNAGGNLTVTVGRGVTGFNATRSHVSTTLDGTLLDLGRVNDPAGGADGRLADGSIVITLDEGMLNALTPGVYTLAVNHNRAIFTGGPAEATITVTAPGGEGADVPKTGDSTPLALLCGLALLSGAGLVMRKKRRQV